MATMANAVDQEPISRSLMEQKPRYFLVGVIADSGVDRKGVAVIKDATSGKSITMKVGDQVEGHAGLRLIKVSRNFAVLQEGSKTINITVDTSAQPSEPVVQGELDFTVNEDYDDQSERPVYTNDPELFERWYSSLRGKTWSGDDQSITQPPSGDSLPQQTLGDYRQRSNRSTDRIERAITDDDLKYGIYAKSPPKRIYPIIQEGMNDNTGLISSPDLMESTIGDQ